MGPYLILIGIPRVPVNPFLEAIGISGAHIHPSLESLGMLSSPSNPLPWLPRASTKPFEEGKLDAVRITLGFSDYFRFPETRKGFQNSKPGILTREP